MAIFRRKADLISDRARDLSNEIAALEAQIQELDSQLQRGDAAPSHPRLRSTALPHGAAVSRFAGAPDTPILPGAAAEPIFEEIDQNRLKARGENGGTPEHYNELGVRKYDFPALLNRIRGHFRGPSTTNPKLVNYLAAGGIQGLRPMRYEKRVARNRFIVLVISILLVLLGVFVVFFRP